MKKVAWSTVLLLILTIGLQTKANAQAVMRKHDSMLSIGMGVGSWGGYAALMPTATYEYTVVGGIGSAGKGAVTIGAYGGFYGTVERHNNLVAFDLGARMTFHYAVTRDVDLNAGLALGGYFGNDSGLSFGVPLGIRFYADSQVAFYIEAAPGSAYPYVLGGVSFRL